MAAAYALRQGRKDARPTNVGVRGGRLGWSHPHAAAPPTRVTHGDSPQLIPFLFPKCSECCCRTIAPRYSASSGPSPATRGLMPRSFPSPFSMAPARDRSGGGTGTTAPSHCPVLSHHYCSLLLAPVTGTPGSRQRLVTLCARGRSDVPGSWLPEPLLRRPCTPVPQPRTATCLFCHLHPPKKFDHDPFSLKYVEISFFFCQSKLWNSSRQNLFLFSTL